MELETEFHFSKRMSPFHPLELLSFYIKVTQNVCFVCCDLVSCQIYNLKQNNQPQVNI